MKTTTTTIRGLAMDVLVIETRHTDERGTLFYRAEFLIRERRSGAQRLVRRTRIPGAAKELAQAVQQRGVRALETFSPPA